jgi:hypothetical protein
VSISLPGPNSALRQETTRRDPLTRILVVLLLLAAIFVALKLLGSIAWPWWLVTAPLWAIPALPLGIVLAAILYFAVAESNDSGRRHE